jgi:hypothetical protein
LMKRGKTTHTSPAHMQEMCKIRFAVHLKQRHLAPR